MPKKALTGTQQKAQKKLAKLEPKFAKEALRNFRSRGSFSRGASREIKDIARGAGEPVYEPSAEYEPSKFKQQTKYEKSNLQNLLRDFERAGKGAEAIFKPHMERTLEQFQQNVVPQIQTGLGSEVKGSSALNQALGAAGRSLSRDLEADFQNIKYNLASNLLGQREASRQFGAQFGAQGEQFGAELRNAQDLARAHFYNQQQQFGNQSQLQNLQTRLAAAGANIGQTIIPQFAGALASPYMQSSRGGEQSPSIGSRIGGGLLGGAIGGIGGFLAGGPLGAAAGATYGGIKGAGF